MKALKNLSLLKNRHKADLAVAGLPGLITKAEKAVASILIGEHAQRKAGTGEKFWQFREYGSADRPQDIDWRQSAKGDRLFVREKEWQTTQTVYLWCQNDKNMDYHSGKALPTKQDCAIVLTLGMGILLNRAGEKLAPLQGGVLPGRSEIAIRQLGETILDTPSGAFPSAQTRKIPRNASLILAGDFLSPFEDMKKSFDLLAEMADNVILLQVLDPAELTLPFDGRVIFEDAVQHASEKRFHIDNVNSIREAYQKRIENHIDQIKHYCRQHQWQWLLHTTDEQERDTLFDAWMMMAPESFHSGGAT